MSRTHTARGPSEHRPCRSRFRTKFFLLLCASSIALAPEAVLAAERRGVVSVAVHLNAPADAKRVDLWIPYPVSDEYQEITDAAVGGNYSAAGVRREGAFGNAILHAEWDAPTADRTLTFSFHVRRREEVTNGNPGEEPPFSGEEFGKYLAATRFGPTDGAVGELAGRITRGKKTAFAKAAAVYDWVVTNMHRDPDVKGCGLGDVDPLLRSLGGKCADISSVFVALSRSAGVPAREIFGIRIPSGKEGDMTKAQHCWAEFYRPGFGWVVVDPADVRKAMLVKKLSLEEARPLREYYFGSVDAGRIAFGTGRDLTLSPPQRGGPLNYFMYPYAEADGKPLNEDLFGFNLGYTIAFKEK